MNANGNSDFIQTLGFGDLESALDQSHVLAFITNLDGVICWVNQSFCNYTGFSTAECIGQKPSLLKSGETPEDVYSELWSTLALDKPWRGFFINNCKNGNHYIEECSISKFYALDQTPYYLAIQHNPSDHQNRNSDLKWSKYFARHILDHFPNPIWTCLPTGERDYYNPSWLRILGINAEEFTPETWEKHVHPQDLFLAKNALQAGINRQQPFEISYRIKNLSGRYRWISEEIKPVFDENGTFKGMIGSCVDITESKGLQDALQIAKARIEAKGQYKSEIFESISSQALNLTSSVLDQFLSLDSTGLKENQIEQFNTLCTQVMEIQKHLQDLSEFARIEAHPPRLQFQEFDLNELILSVHDETSIDADHKGLRFYAEISQEHEALHIVHDQNIIRRILKLLLENAIVSLSDGFLRIAYEKSQTDHMPEICLWVEGWKGEHQNDAFCTIDHRNHPRLAIAESIATQVGGSILIKREECDHLNYEVRLPLQQQNKAIEQQATIPDKGLILVAEDDEIFVMIIEDLLRLEGYQVIKAKNGREAVEIALSDRNFSMILMDLQMPEMDGFEATRLIKKAIPNLPIVALTGHKLEDRLQEFLEADFVDYLAKPYTRLSLQGVLKHARPTSSKVGAHGQ